MPDEISTQILAQTSENMQKLFDLSTRIDERVKAIQEKQVELTSKLADLTLAHVEIMQKVAVLESQRVATDSDEQLLRKEMDVVEANLTALDKRIAVLEGEHGNHKDRWNRILGFIIQLVWVILAAYLLTKLHLQAPAVP